MMISCCKCLRHCFAGKVAHITEVTAAGRLSTVLLSRYNTDDCKDEAILKPSLCAKNRITKPVKPKLPDLSEDEDMYHRERLPGGRNRKKHVKRYEKDGFSKRDTHFGSVTNERDWGFDTHRTVQRSYNKNYNYGLPGQGKRREARRAALTERKGDVLFGLYPVLLALTANRRQFYELLIKPSLLESSKPLVMQLLALAEQRGVRIKSTDTDELYELSLARPHQGVCLHTEKLTHHLADDDAGVEEEMRSNSPGPKVWVVLDSIQDPMNFGAVLRSAYFLGADRVFTVKGNSCPLSPVVSKASAGTMEVIDIHEVQNLLDFIKNHRETGWHILGTTASRDKTEEGRTEMQTTDRVTALHDIKLTQDTMLVLGNEGAGMSSHVVALCDQLVTIKPQQALHPFMDSLNVSVAAGIILHHLTSFKWR